MLNGATPYALASMSSLALASSLGFESFFGLASVTLGLGVILGLGIFLRLGARLGVFLGLDLLGFGDVRHGDLMSSLGLGFVFLGPCFTPLP